MDALAQDIRHAARSLRRSPAFTSAALLTLALGIGATSAIFTIVNAALLEPPPYPDPDRLLVLGAREDFGSAQTGQLFLYLRDRLTSVEHVAAQRGSNGWNLSARGIVTYVGAQVVSEDYFAAHRVQPLLGRGFSRAETAPRGPNAAVLSEPLWQQVYGGRSDAIGQIVLLGGVPHAVVGVMPRTFRSIPAADVWTPLRTTPSDNGQNYRIFGRLRDGSTPAQAAAELDAVRADVLRTFPRANPRRVMATAWMPLRDLLGADLRQELLLLLGAVGFLLLMLCVNIGSLQLTRALARRREMATRAALGGSRIRLARQALTESALLGTAGALAGIAIAIWTTQLLLGSISEELAGRILNGASPALDWRVLGFTTVVALLASFLFGIAPALVASRVDVRHALNGTTVTMSRQTVWLRRVLAGTEVALAAILLVGAGLLLRTLINLNASDLGFRPDNVLVGRMSLQGAVEDGVHLESLFDRALDRIRRLPRVVAATASSSVPVDRGLNLPIEPPPRARIQETRSIDWRYVTSGYFDVFDIALRAGRLFDDRDRSGGSPVAIVNEAFARTYFGRIDVVGQTIGLVPGLQDQPREIVGVVKDMKARSGSGWTGGLTALGSGVAPAMFVPAGQAPASSIRMAHGAFEMTWSARTSQSRPELEREMQQALRAVDPRLAFIEFESMDAVIARDLDLPRFIASLLGGFAALGVMLAAVGLYGLMAYAASQRTREVGIRMALGATGARIRRGFMTEGVATAATGLVLGLAGALLLTRLLSALLFGVTPVDAATFALVAILLLAIAALATLIPAHRAARTPPVQALRAE